VLLILIPIAWLTVLTLVLAVCCAAARADRAPSQVAAEYPGSGGNVLIVWETAGRGAWNVNRRSDASCPIEHRARLRSGRPASHRRVAAHPSR
jgi:hypothetical protein